MFDTDAYLKRLGYTGPVAPTVELLRELHKRHLMAIPFDNALNSARGLDIWEQVDIDVDAIFDAVVTGRRGGVCHEIGGLFRNLLVRLGFDVQIMAAGVRMANGFYGPELEHMFTVVTLDGQRWIADVGFAGPSFTEPLRFAPGVQEIGGASYELVPDGTPGGTAWILHRRPAGGQWQPIYRFPERVRELPEWKGEPNLRAYAAELTRAETLIRGRATEDGQLTLIGRRFTRVVDGTDTVKVIVDATEYAAAVEQILTPGI